MMEDLIRSDDAAGKEESGQDLEQMFTELEALIGKMEDSDVTLEQSFDLYNRGMELLKNVIRRSIQ